MKKVKFQARQGDVLIESTNALPALAKRAKGRVVLAEGEATGHAHEIDQDAGEAWKEHGQTVAVVATRPTQVKHQEHAPIELAPGKYKVTRQREYSPEAIRNVAD